MTTKEHRRKPRYRCRCYAKILSTQTVWEGHLLNLSETGALVGIIEPHAIALEDELELLVEIQGNEVINLAGTVVHINEHYIGIDCEPRTQNDYARLKLRLDTLEHQDTLTTGVET